MVVLWAWDHTLLGNLTNGTKIVYTAVHCGWGDKQTITVDPIEAIFSYYPGVKEPGFAPTIFTYGTFSDHSNIIYIQAAADADGAELGIISFGI
jgi:hypothetical protein